ncbi:MAG TPA: LPXTG cell wall anchor domain-containing protein [Terriglobales bacterium]|nr:LPXTG cell wall anchor domain-containing protein [Terriglobales bacterium]
MKFNVSGKLGLYGLLAFSMSCLGQVVSTGGYAGTTGVNVANAPLVSTPDIALPGSGPAVGVPLGSANNDSRVSLGPSVYDPNLISTGVEEPGSSQQSAASANNQAFSMGIQTFVSGLPESANRTPSLAEIAARNKARIPKSVRVINNDTIADLNARGVQTGNLGLGNTVATAAPAGTQTPTEANATTPTAPAANGTLMAKNEAPALPQSDEIPEPSPTASQQRHAQTQPSATESNASTEAPAQNQAAANQQPAPAPSAQLPHTGSVLPLLFLFGAIAVVGGGLYFVRR